MAKIIDELNKKYGKRVIFRPSDAPHRPKYRIPYESPTLNRASGGGILVPRITHLYGPPSVYKSTGIYKLIASAQKIRDDIPKSLRGDAKLIVLIDTEQSYSTKYLRECGIDIDDPNFVIVDDFATGDELVDIMVDFMKSGKVMLMCLDSLTTVLSGREDESAMADLIKLPGWTGQFTSKMFKKVHAANTGNTALVFANQVRDDVGAMMDRARQSKSGGSPTGGNAPKFYSSDIMELRKQTEEVEGHYSKLVAPHGTVDRRKFIGNVISVRVEKTRSSGNENLELFFRYVPENGRTDMEQEVIDLCRIDGIIKQSKPGSAHWVYQTPDMKKPEKLAHGKDNMRFKLVKDRELFQKLLDAVEEKSRQIGAFE